MLKIVIEDFYSVVETIEKLLKNQYDDHRHKLNQEKKKTFNKLNRNLIKNLIKKMSSYALLKIHDQYRMIMLIAKNSKKHALKTCFKSFNTTMNFSCSHMIKTTMKIEEKKILLENVHSH